MGYTEIAQKVHENAVAHGWLDGPRSYAEIIALIHSELSEALEEYRDGKPNLYYVNEWSQDVPIQCSRNATWHGTFDNNKPEGVIIELADAVIRILDYCGMRKLDIGFFIEVRNVTYDATYTLPELVANCHYTLSMAYKQNGLGVVVFLAEFIHLISFWCDENGCELLTALDIKNSYNIGRPYRHGGKKL